MSERDGYAPGVPCRVVTIQHDPGAAATFYAGRSDPAGVAFSITRVAAAG